MYDYWYMNETLFEKHDIFCPVCRSQITLFELRSSSYIVTKRELDGYASEYKWYSEGAEANDIHFHMYWTCPECIYTDKITNFFKIDESVITLFEADFREVFQRGLKTKDNFLVAVGNQIKMFSPYSYEYAVFQGLIYIYTLHKLEINADLYHKLGEAYLRLSWLFLNKSNTHSRTEINFGQLLLEHFETYEARFNDLKQETEHFKNTVINILHKNVNESNKEQIKYYYKNVKNFSTNIEKSINYISSLNTMFIDSNKKGRPTEPSEHTHKASLNDSLNHLKNHWSNLPTSERSSVLLANEHLKHALNTGYYNNDIQNICNACKVIVYGYEKLSAFSELDSFLESGLKVLYSLFTQLKKEIIELDAKRDKLTKRIESIKTDQLSSTSILKESLKDLEEILSQKKAHIRTIKIYSSEFKNSREKARKVVLAEELEMISSLISETDLNEKKEIISMLKEKNISEYAIENYFKEEKAPEKKVEKKSGLLGFLKGK